VILKVSEGMNTLLHLQHQRFVRAEKGTHGMGSNKTGKRGADTVIHVPPGTVVRNAETGEMLGDLVEKDEELIVARGGKGGRGNARFSTSENQAPRHAEEGLPGESFDVELELKLLADVGLVGLPNAGKSTLLSRLSAARPKIADYPFTTLEPYLGVVKNPDDDYLSVVMADIPGLIEGAHEGAGLGIQFLRHVERCQLLAHLVDLSVETPPVRDRIETIRGEIEAYGLALARRPWFLVGTKVDAVANREAVVHDVKEIADAFAVPFCVLSVVSGEGLTEMIRVVFRISSEQEESF
jgi:GTP-binding protein